jgi:hypothetical protein
MSCVDGPPKTDIGRARRRRRWPAGGTSPDRTPGLKRRIGHKLALLAFVFGNLLVVYAIAAITYHLSRRSGRLALASSPAAEAFPPVQHSAT